MVTWRQFWRLRRHFIVVYQYQTKDGVTGQGQCTIINSEGKFIQVKNLVEGLEKEFKVDIEQFVLLNVMELNFRDFKYYIEHSKFKDEKL